MTLPPVPESLRQLAQRQLDNEPVLKLRSVRKIIHDLALNAKLMQSNIIQRTHQPGSFAHVDGGWANGADWSRLMGQYENAIEVLRAAWLEVRDTEPAVQQVLQTWRAANGIAPEVVVNEDVEEFWLLFSPAIELALRDTHTLIEAAMGKWGAATARYFELLQHSKAAAVYGPQLPSTKTRRLSVEEPPQSAAA